MKELSIEEKAYDGNYKVYTELINRLEDVKNAIKKQNYGIAMDILYKPYPGHQITTSTEFTEYEDEEIRKGLIQYFNDFNLDTFAGLDPKKILAWLEKQVDKDKLIKELGEYKVKYTQEVLEKHINSMENKDDERLRKTTISFLKDFTDKGYENAVECIDWLEKQGEQNPTDEEMKEALRTEYEKGRADTIAEMQKEWSEEDEEMLKMAIKSCEQCGNGYAYYWLKSLKDRVQPKVELKQEH